MNMALRRCGLESAEQVQSICGRLFGTGRRGVEPVMYLKTEPWKVTRILQMRAEGRIIREIAKEVKISKATIIEILRGNEKGEK